MKNRFNGAYYFMCLLVGLGCYMKQASTVAVNLFGWESHRSIIFNVGVVWEGKMVWFNTDLASFFHYKFFRKVAHSAMAVFQEPLRLSTCLQYLNKENT